MKLNNIKIPFNLLLLMLCSLVWLSVKYTSNYKFDTMLSANINGLIPEHGKNKLDKAIEVKLNGNTLHKLDSCTAIHYGDTLVFFLGQKSKTGIVYLFPMMKKVLKGEDEGRFQYEMEFPTSVVLDDSGFIMRKTSFFVADFEKIRIDTSSSSYSFQVDVKYDLSRVEGGPSKSAIIEFFRPSKRAVIDYWSLKGCLPCVVKHDSIVKLQSVNLLE